MDRMTGLPSLPQMSTEGKQQASGGDDGTETGLFAGYRLQKSSLKHVCAYSPEVQVKEIAAKKKRTVDATQPSEGLPGNMLLCPVNSSQGVYDRQPIAPESSPLEASTKKSGGEDERTRLKNRLINEYAKANPLYGEYVIETLNSQVSYSAISETETLSGLETGAGVITESNSPLSHSEQALMPAYLTLLTGPIEEAVGEQSGTAGSESEQDTCTVPYIKSESKKTAIKKKRTTLKTKKKSVTKKEKKNIQLKIEKKYGEGFLEAIRDALRNEFYNKVMFDKSYIEKRLDDYVKQFPAVFEEFNHDFGKIAEHLIEGDDNQVIGKDNIYEMRRLFISHYEKKRDRFIRANIMRLNHPEKYTSSDDFIEVQIPKSSAKSDWETKVVKLPLPVDKFDQKTLSSNTPEISKLEKKRLRARLTQQAIRNRKKERFIREASTSELKCSNREKRDSEQYLTIDNILKCLDYYREKEHGYIIDEYAERVEIPALADMIFYGSRQMKKNAEEIFKRDVSDDELKNISGLSRKVRNRLAAAWSRAKEKALAANSTPQSKLLSGSTEQYLSGKSSDTCPEARETTEDWKTLEEMFEDNLTRDFDIGDFYIGDIDDIEMGDPENFGDDDLMRNLGLNLP
ncbi:hypothetical protein [Endozoicomonas lisbonensis]|uniref:Uncharacterized protein n=1 Tax=Endozoicomonas lisbonensis TaxID=3120522 RepID=A0ABV2SHH1_9GAMM